MRLPSLRLRTRVLLSLCSAIVAGPAPGQETESAQLVVAPQEIAVNTDELTWTELDLSNGGDGDLVWTACVDAPWLKLAGAQDRLPVDRLAGEGEGVLQVRTIGRGLARDTYDGRVLIDVSGASGGSVTVPVTMTVRREPTLGPAETRIDPAAVPPGVWSTPFAVPVAQVLNRSLEEAADQLQQLSGLELRDVRVVAVTSQRVLYVAAEDEYKDQASGLTRREARVWTSADGGATWSPLLRASPHGDCYYSTRVQSAALHPDGERVFLGVTDGLFLDYRKVHGPSGLTNIDALHVSADGYLYVVVERLDTACGASSWPSSDNAVYYGRITEGWRRIEWDGGRSALVDFLAPVADVGSDPADRDVVYLRAASGGLPAGRWVHLSLPAEALHDHPNSYPNFGPEDPQPTLLTQLGFRADAPLWLDEIHLLGAVPEDGPGDFPTAVSGRSEPTHPRAVTLLPAYPNPFNAAAVIPFHLGEGGKARMMVYDVLGRHVRTLVDGDLRAGDHQVTWDGRDDDGVALGTGLYLCRLAAGGGRWPSRRFCSCGRPTPAHGPRRGSSTKLAVARAW